MVFFAHEQNPLNPGDSSCSPASYLDFGSKVQKFVCIRNIEKEKISSSDTVILGGGGLLNGTFHPLIDSIFQKNPKIIFWSIGTNLHFWSQPPRNSVLGTFNSYILSAKAKGINWKRNNIYTKYESEVLTKASLSGVRDYQDEFTIIPCPTCLHPIFDDFSFHPNKNTEIKGIFEHSSFFPLKENRKEKKFDYMGRDMVSVVSDIASCSSIVTSSYHCAYWGMLLGKKVSIRSFSTKHLYLKPLLQVAKSQGLSFLDWSRKRNLEFRNEIEQFL